MIWNEAHFYLENKTINSSSYKTDPHAIQAIFIIFRWANIFIIMLLQSKKMLN